MAADTPTLHFTVKVDLLDGQTVHRATLYTANGQKTEADLSTLHQIWLEGVEVLSGCVKNPPGHSALLEKSGLESGIEVFTHQLSDLLLWEMYEGQDGEFHSDSFVIFDSNEPQMSQEETHSRLTDLKASLKTSHTPTMRELYEASLEQASKSEAGEQAEPEAEGEGARTEGWKLEFPAGHTFATSKSEADAIRARGKKLLEGDFTHDRIQDYLRDTLSSPSIKVFAKMHTEEPYHC